MVKITELRKNRNELPPVVQIAGERPDELIMCVRTKSKGEVSMFFERDTRNSKDMLTLLLTSARQQEGAKVDILTPEYLSEIRDLVEKRLYEPIPPQKTGMLTGFSPNAKPTFYRNFLYQALRALRKNVDAGVSVPVNSEGEAYLDPEIKATNKKVYLIEGNSSERMQHQKINDEAGLRNLRRKKRLLYLSLLHPDEGVHLGRIDSEVQRWGYQDLIAHAAHEPDFEELKRIMHLKAGEMGASDPKFTLIKRRQYEAAANEAIREIEAFRKAMDAKKKN